MVDLYCSLQCELQSHIHSLTNGGGKHAIQIGNNVQCTLLLYRAIHTGQDNDNDDQCSHQLRRCER